MMIVSIIQKIIEFRDGEERAEGKWYKGEGVIDSKISAPQFEILFF